MTSPSDVVAVPSQTTIEQRTEYVVCYADLRGKGWPRIEVKRFTTADDADPERAARDYAYTFMPRAKAYVVEQIITVTERRL